LSGLPTVFFREKTPWPGSRWAGARPQGCRCSWLS